MYLAEEEITIPLSGERITLRPTLRAAARLERRHGGFDAILKGLEEVSLTVIADLIGECATEPTDAPAMIVEGGLGWRLAPIVPALQVLVLGLTGYDPDAEETPAGDGENAARTTFAKVHGRYFRLATGWLGWTPAETWAASPAEIKNAYEGRVELLRAVFGGGEEKPQNDAASADDRFKAGMAALGTRKVTRAA